MSTASPRKQARRLLAELNEFTTATAALSGLFEALFEGPERGVRLLRQLLAWQSLAWQSMRALHDVVTDFDAHDDNQQEGDESAATIDSQRQQQQPPLLLLVMGKPALLFATSIYDEELALLVWRGLVRFQQLHPHTALALAPQVFDNAHDSHGFCALHYAIEAQMEEFMQQVAQDLGAVTASPGAASTRYDVAQLTRRVRTQDVVLPMGKNQIQGKNIASGGCTLLHLAAKKGELTIVKMLVAPPFCLDISGGDGALELWDFDGNTPLQLALLHGHDDVAAFLQVRR